MIQEMHHSTVPEELYNLTQLADVTLAAGKLSTTNLEQIKNYIRNEENVNNLTTYQDEFRTGHTTNKSSHSDNEMLDINLKDLKLHPKFGVYQQTNFIRENDEKIYAINKLSASHERQKFTENDTHSTIRLQNPTLDQSILELNSTIAANQYDKHQLSLSSSEEETIFNYSHKIFDKRKSRKLSYHSDDSDCNVKKKHFTENRLNMYFGNGSHREIDDSQFSSETDSYEYGEMGKITIDTNGEDVHVCPECGKKYSTSSNLARHRQTHRSLMDKKARRCPHCDKVYVSMPAFSMHVRTHNQGCECPHCGKRFSRPWLLQGHIRTHTGEKPFQCSICAKAFADKSNLRAHVQTHSNTKPHTCGRCGKAFALKSYLYKHEESSCMRNQVKIPERERIKYTRTDSTKTTASSIVAKILRKGRSTTTNSGDTAKKLKEKFATHLNSTKLINHTTNIQSTEGESIVMDYGSQKSYIDLTNPISKRDFENFSRISVIRTALTNASATNNGGYEGIHLGYYQEKPMDFSPKNKFQNNNLNGNFECSRNYAIVV